MPDLTPPPIPDLNCPDACLPVGERILLIELVDVVLLKALVERSVAYYLSYLTGETSLDLG